MAGTLKDARDPNEKTYSCHTCGRNFIKSSLVKHEPACKKLTKMQRKIFDSGKQRANNSDIPYKAIKKAALEKEKYGGVFPRPKTHWRERHEEFIGAVSASKHVEHALKTGAPLPPPPKSSVPSDYVHCKYCGRNFNQTAANRHIPLCKEQNERRRTSRSRANSTGRIPTSKSLNGPGRSSSRGQSPATRSATSASRQQLRTSSSKPPTSRRSSTRQPTAASVIPPTANGTSKRGSLNMVSASHTRASALPMPTSPRAPTSKPKTPSTKPRAPSVKPKIAVHSKAPKTPKTPNLKPKTPKRSKSRSPVKPSIFSLSSLTGFALGAPLSQSTKHRDKSPKSSNSVKNSQLKSQQRVRTSASVKRR